MEQEDKIELIINTCTKLADILKDPSEGRASMTSEERSTARETAHEELLVCIDVLASCAKFNHGFFDVLDIAGRYSLNVKDVIAAK